MRTLGLVAVLAVVLVSSGCVAAPALVPAAFSAGGDLVKAGTVRIGGATFRTFSLPLAEVYQATRKTLDSLGFASPDEEKDEERVILRAHAVDRTVRIDLQPITPVMTQMRVFVRKNTLTKDLATASELVAQTERTLAGAEDRQTRRTAGERRTR
jgi:Protein of unknown function (DUF3568)